MDNASLLEQILTATLPLVTMLAMWGSVELRKFVKVRVSNEYAQGALLRLEEVTRAVVRSAHQETVKGLKAASQDGKLTSLEAVQIKNDALIEIKEYLGKNGISDLEKIVNRSMIEDFIRARIESEVLDVREWTPQD